MRIFLLSVMALVISGVAEAAPKSVLGVWVGKYICGQGITRLTLDVRADKGNRVKATFRFGPVKENPSVPLGSYRMSGTYSALTRRIDLKGVEWVDRPLGYEMVDLRGSMSADGLALKGDVPFVGCSVFELTRDADKIA